MCAMKEVTLFADDAKSKESAKQLGQVSLLAISFVDAYFLRSVKPFFLLLFWSLYFSFKFNFCCLQEIVLLSRLRHPNIVQYYGSETVSHIQEISCYFFNLGEALSVNFLNALQHI